MFRLCMKTETTFRYSKVASRWAPRTELGMNSRDIKAPGQTKPAQKNTHNVKTFALARHFPLWMPDHGGHRGGGPTLETEGSDKQKHCCFSGYWTRHRRLGTGRGLGQTLAQLMD